MRSGLSRGGRHRVGMAGGVHCVLIPEVAAALYAYRRNWFVTLFRPARHSLNAIRRRTSVAVSPRLVPIPVT